MANRGMDFIYPHTIRFASRVHAEYLTALRTALDTMA